jgi:hypothetical protein
MRRWLVVIHTVAGNGEYIEEYTETGTCEECIKEMYAKNLARNQYITVDAIDDVGSSSLGISHQYRMW